MHTQPVFPELVSGNNDILEAFLGWRRNAFPFFEHKTFLTHASVSPLPGHTCQALQEYAAHIAQYGQFDAFSDTYYFGCKERIAALLRDNQAPATPEEIAFAGSTSHALGLVATSIDWKAGENCVVADGDFPANVVIWKNLQHTHGVETRLVPHRPQMDLTLDDIKLLVDEKTRIVSLASCNFLSGFPLNLKEIGTWLRERGVLFCVDGIQTLGAVRCDFSQVDFVCADSHKWLLGPNGIAFLWVRGEVLKTLRPAIFGWLAGQKRDDWFSYDTTPIDNAERFEPGARNYLGIVAFNASLEVLHNAGPDIVENRVVHLRTYAAQKLTECGYNVLWQGDTGYKTGIVSFRAQTEAQTLTLYKKLDENFALSLRNDKAGQVWIRISSHFMNCQEDIDALAATLSNE